MTTLEEHHDPGAGTPHVVAYGPPTSLFHWVTLGLSTVVLLLSLVLSVRGQEEVVIPVLNQPLPGVCSFKRVLGIGCPGCGLTRCFISLGHGEIERAWSFNPAGFVLFAALLFQFPYRIAQIWRIRKGLPEFRLGLVGAWASIGAAVLLILQWSFRNLGWM